LRGNNMEMLLYQKQLRDRFDPLRTENVHQPPAVLWPPIHDPKQLEKQGILVGGLEDAEYES